MYRIGLGSDIHRLVSGRPLIIGGVRIASELGAEGHSDADVLFHAVTDAILGALALGDIGAHFPNTDPQWQDAPSSMFLEHTVRFMNERGYAIENLDATIHLERPKLRDHIESMRENLSGIMFADLGSISIKAKTGEGLDAVGRLEAIRASAIVLLRLVAG